MHPNKDILTRIVFLLAFQTLLHAQAGEDPAEALLRWNRIAVQDQDAGQFAEARTSYEHAIEAAGMAKVTAKTRLRLRLNLISLYLEEGAYRDAEAGMNKARDLAREIEAGSCDLAGLHNYDGLLHLVQGRLTPARRAGEAALAIAERPECPGGEELASVLQNLASVEIRQAAYGDAQRHAQRALEILQGSKGAHTSQLIRLLASMSTLEYLREDWTGAEESAKRALQLAERHYGPTHPIVGDVLQNYALILERLHRKKEARAYRRKANALLAGVPAGSPPTVDLIELRKSALDVSVLTK